MKKILRNGDNTYYYYYDLHKVQQDGPNGIEERWDFTKFLLRGIPNLKDCIRSVIRHFVTSDEEFDLINSFNMPDRSDEDLKKYYKYLDLVKEIKLKVKLDFNDSSIKDNLNEPNMNSNEQTDLD